MLFDVDVDELPVYGTVASQFNDPGVNNLYTNLLKIVEEKQVSSLFRKIIPYHTLPTKYT